MSGWSDIDEQMMRAALDEARCAATTEEVPVGAVLAMEDEIVGRGHNFCIINNDPTAHAEIIALRDAGRKTENYRFPTATLYVTLEPCAMCMGALVNARIRRLVFSAYDEKAGAAGSALDLMAEKSIRHRIEVNGGLFASDSAEILAAFFEKRRR